jgi:glutamine synthetase
LNICSGWDIHDSVYSKELLISNKANGYRDVTAVIDLSSFRRIPWEHNVPFFLVFFLDPETKDPLSVDPRGVLQVATERALQAGYDCFSGVEYEVRMNSCQESSWDRLLLTKWAVLQL